MTLTGPQSSWRKRRLSTRISLSELARRSGVNKGALSRIERGWPASVAEAAALVRALEEAEASKPEATP